MGEGRISRRAAQFGLGAALLLMVLCMSVLFVGASRGNDRGAVAGAPAANFRLPDLSGQLVSLESLRGKVVVLLFSGQKMSPSDLLEPLEGFGDAFKSNDRVKVLAVHSSQDDTQAEHVEEFRSLATNHHIYFPSLVDHSADVTKQYKVDKSPTVFVIAPDGVIRYRGEFAAIDAAHAAVDELLKR